ncbi:hypothetical protein [Negadavirga shengliensis]|uniref:Glycosyl hydrolase-like 10 domain-containing protein n=1 Tax=Negadavirga shengliensis TaxID=1389218 RepID=A0ABV9T023_9BACT
MGIVNLLLLLVIFSSCASSNKKADRVFVKGVYGNPGSLLRAGYFFDSLGMNAVFVRSISLTPQFYETARQQGCQVFVEFPTLNGKDYLEDHPEAWPINEKGEQEPAADWFMGICPTHPGFKEHRANQLRNIMDEFDVDGVFLNYLHWHAQFETPYPILPETCFCNRCVRQFEMYADREVKGEDISQKADWILTHADKEWRDWRNSILNGWVQDMKDVVKSHQPEALLGVYYCAWYPENHHEALYRTLGIDVKGLARIADVLSPMLFHKMKDRPPVWVGQYLDWLESQTQAGKKGTPLVWPIVQAHNSPGIVSPGEFREVMLEGSKYPSSGIMMFSDVSLVEDPEKVEVMRDLYIHGFK